MYYIGLEVWVSIVGLFNRSEGNVATSWGVMFLPESFSVSRSTDDRKTQKFTTA